MSNIEQYKILHKQKGYGKSSEKLYNDILPLVKEINPSSILDYGCGQSDLVGMFGCMGIKYDPAIEEYSKYIPYKVDLVICIDVLEHIPDEDLEETLLKIKVHSEKVIFDIGTQLAKHTLPNGDNAHCTVKSIDWWINKLKETFPIITFVKDIRGVKFLCKTW